MKTKTISILILALALLMFTDNFCPLHSYAVCYWTGQTNYPSGAKLYHCSCGDSVWVK